MTKQNGTTEHPSNNRRERTNLDRFEELVANITSLRAEAFRQLLDPRRDIDDECGYPPGRSAVNIETYKLLYDREAIAARVVEVFAKESWQAQPLVYEDDASETSTEFEEAWDDLGRNLMGERSWHSEELGSPVWEHLLRADILSGIGHFGVLLLGLDDGQSLETPVDPTMVANDGYLTEQEENRLRAAAIVTNSDRRVIDRWCEERKAIRQLIHNQLVVNKTEDQNKEVPGTEALYSSGYGPFSANPTGGQLSGTDQQYFGVQFGPSEEMPDKPSKKKRKLLFLRAFDESLVQIVRYEWNIRSPRFAMPIMYRITLNDPREQHSGVGLPMATVFVHWSRVIHLADNRGSSEIFGIPRMRPVLNRLLDLQKLYGGSAEMYWRGAFPGLSLETHPTLGGDVEVDETGIRDTMENYFNGLQRYIQMSGMSAKTLAPTVVDPSPQITSQVEAICIKLGIPVRVFKGSERGELASTQDDASWNDRLRSRQQYYITPRVICPFIDRLILIGVLPEPEEYKVEWPDLDSLTDLDKSTIANNITTALAAYVSGGVENLIPPHEYLTKIHHFDEEEAETILDAAQEHMDELNEADAAMAEEQGFEPAPPEGFQAPEPEEPPQPVKLKPGEKLVHPPPPPKNAQPKASITAPGKPGASSTSSAKEKSTTNAALENQLTSDEAAAIYKAAKRALAAAEGL